VPKESLVPVPWNKGDTSQSRQSKKRLRPREHDTDTNAAACLSDDTYRRLCELECSFSRPSISQ